MRAHSPLCLIGIALGVLSASVPAQETFPPVFETARDSSDVIPAAYERGDYSPRLLTRFDDGFVAYTEDDEFELRIKLMEQTDGKLFIPEEQQPARPGLYIPRFRLYFEGHITPSYEYELSLQRSVEGTSDGHGPNACAGTRFCPLNERAQYPGDPRTRSPSGRR